MNAYQKMKVQRALDKVLSGQFDENDANNLFMGLRPYCDRHRVFREIADFIAHNDVRNRGIIQESIERLFLTIKYFLAYEKRGITLNISNPFPIFVKRLMKLQVDLCKPAELRKKFNISPENLKSRIDKLFKEDKKTNNAVPRKQIRSIDLSIIKHILGFWSLNPAFSVDDLMQDLADVLQANRLNFEKNTLMARRDLIVLYVILLIHTAEFIYDERTSCKCFITFFPTDTDQEIDKSNAPNRIPSNTLLLTAFLKIDDNGVPIMYAHHVICSDLSVFEHCEESLLKNEENETENPGLLFFDELLYLTENAKLGSISGKAKP